MVVGEDTNLYLLFTDVHNNKINGLKDYLLDANGINIYNAASLKRNTKG
jgi:hypothetical protein